MPAITPKGKRLMKLLISRTQKQWNYENKVLPSGNVDKIRKYEKQLAQLEKEISKLEKQ